MEPRQEVIIDEDYVAKKAEPSEEMEELPDNHKYRCSDSLADKIYEEIKEKNIMK
jgi:heterodisulfide reductase subunit A-like polyferredoxin